MESRRKRCEPAHPPGGTGRGADAVLVEEEPAHELYANLCGIDPSKHSYSAAVSGAPAPRLGACGGRSRAPPSGVAVVPTDGESAERAKDDGHDDRGRHGDLFCTSHASSVTGGPSRSEPTSTPAPASVAEHLRMALSHPDPSPALSDLTLDGTNCQKGFEMLKRMGWRESDGGLGRRRQGGMIPVKTRLPNPKRPRAGLGVRGGLGKARVTHKAANGEARAVAESDGGDPTTRAERRKLARSEAERERRRDKRIRMMLRTDVSSEYEELYLKLHRSNC